jgi:nicotinate-nucleotide adenylyltransferase
MALPGERIGLVGGTFNPPHEAHVLISHIALKRLGLTRIWWLVTPGNPLKDNGGLPPLEARMASASAMACDPRIVVTGFEAGLPTTFTAATLGFLAARRPGASFVWVMGADNLAQIHRWRHWRDIFRLMPVAVVDRPGWRLAALAAPAARAFRSAHVPEARAGTLPSLDPPAWTFLTGPLSPLSSTALRRLSRNGNKPSKSARVVR